MQMDRKTFAKMRVDGIQERCSACHHAAKFDKDDYTFTPEGS
jgi:hypothetical protein